MNTGSQVRIFIVWALMIACNSGHKPNQASPPAKTGKDVAQVSQLLLNLPAEYNTPDGLAMSASGDLILSVPNFNNKYLLEQRLIKAASPAFMAVITKDNKLAHWYDFKPGDLHPQTGKVGPMDSAFGPDGNLYVADMQVFFDKSHKSRILRINVANNRATSAEVVVEGFVASNGICWKDNHLYVTESVLEAKDSSLVSGVYCFSLNELKRAQPVKLIPYANGKADPHLIVTFQSDNHMGFGADGITFDQNGLLYTTVIEKGQIFRSMLSGPTKVVKTEIFAQGDGLTAPDGLVFDKKRNRFYVADFLTNAVYVIDRNGRVKSLQKNGDTSGANGQLDQPAEVIVRGDELIIVNMDMAWATPGLSVNTKADLKHNLSKIDLNGH